MIAWPLLVVLFGDSIMDFLIQKQQYSFKPPAHSIFVTSFFLTAGGSILLTEGALLSQDYFNNRLKNKTWLTALSIDKMLLIIVIILSVFMAAVGVFRMVQYSFEVIRPLFLIYKFISFFIQLIFVHMMYYFYYYINKQILIPKLLKKKGIIYYGFSVALVILIFYPIFVFLIQHLPIATELKSTLYQSNGKTFNSDGGGFPFLIMFLTVPVIVSNEWFRQNSKIANLEKEKSTTELNLLKQQINPHFFFNTLNNLYALSITKDEQTPEVILKLSELMRYVIYKGKEESVSLKEEVQYIEDYIQLQQIRLHKKLDYTFEKNISDPDQLIPPLLFITFVENAFKHGIEPAEGNCNLHLKLTSNESGLVFSCKNSIEDQINSKAGIGLSNLKRRMELRYPNKHSLETKKTKTDFSANLKLSF